MPLRPLAQVVDAHQLVADVVRAACGQLRLETEHGRIETAEIGFELTFGALVLDPRGGEPGERRAQTGDLATGDVELQGMQLTDEISMASGGFGLTFERPQLTAHLAEQVLHPQEVRFGGLQTPFGLLLALAELEDTGGLLDDPPAVFRTGIEHGVDLPLADDDVLLAADTRIGEQFLDVEQTTWNTVDRVLAVAAAKQDAADGDFGELEIEQAGRVVDREAHLGSAQRRALGGAGKDDVIHLLAPHGTRRLGTEHPRNGVDDVRLPRSVRPDHHRDARLELHHRGIGERLEPFEGQAFQEHSGRNVTRRVRSSRGCRTLKRGTCRGRRTERQHHSERTCGGR